MVELSKEQLHELALSGDLPLRVVDPATQRVYVILPGDLYDRIRPILGDNSFDIRETYAAQQAALAKVWDDPELDIYNDYDSHKPQ